MSRHDNGALVWTWPPTLIVGGFGLALLAVAVAIQSDIPGVIGVVALIVAVSGRLISASELRYGDADFPPLPAPSAVADDTPVRSRAIRRRSGVAYVLAVISGGGLVLAMIVNWHSQPRSTTILEGVLAVGCLTGSYLIGPAARFVVTAQHLHIDTAWHRMSVPRELLGALSGRGQDVRLDLTNGDRRYFRVDSPFLDVSGAEYRSNSRCQVRTVRRIVALLAAVPAGPPMPEPVVTVTRRTGLLVLAVAALVVAVPSLVGIFAIGFTIDR